jgi:hypothetical protein
MINGGYRKPKLNTPIKKVVECLFITALTAAVFLFVAAN